MQAKTLQAHIVEKKEMYEMQLGELSKLKNAADKLNISKKELGTLEG